MTDQIKDNRAVFVVHGRNDTARRGLFDFLRSIGLRPLEWEQAIELTGKASPYIGQVLDAAFHNAQAVVILQTPDDIGYLHDSLGKPDDPDCKPEMQARQNVSFEAGMAMGRDEARTVLVTMGTVRQYSDLHGRHEVRLNNEVASRQRLATRLRTAGCDVNTDGTDWHTAGDLSPPQPPGAGLPLGRKMPSSEKSGTPNFKATLHDRGGNKMSPVRLTNLGPGTAHDIDVRPLDEEILSLGRNADLPIPRLPRGNTVTVMDILPLRLSERARSYFEIIVSARTDDGAPFEETLFVSRD